MLAMTVIPQIRLRTIFLLVTCAAVGFTADPHFLGALEPMIQALMAVGLAQQVRTLAACGSTQAPIANEIRFSRSFGIAWRTVVAITLVGGILYSMLVTRGFIPTSDRDEQLMTGPLHEGVIRLCMLVILCNSLVRWRPAPRGRRRIALYTKLLGIVGLAFLGVNLLSGTSVQFITHRGLSMIEARQPKHLHRPEVYISPAADGYLPHWLGLAAVVSLSAAILLTTWPLGPTLGASKYVRRILIFSIVMIVPTMYCWWWYAREFPRLSPDLAGAGFSLTRSDLACGLCAAITLIVASAYRIALTPLRVVVRPNMAEDIDCTSVHESLPTLMLLILFSANFAASAIVSLNAVPAQSVVRSVISFIMFSCNPLFLLPFAAMIAGLQLSWVRWRRRAETIPDVLFGISPPRFAISGLMIACILAAGVPVLRAFAFTAWIWPYDLLPIFRM